MATATSRARKATIALGLGSGLLCLALHTGTPAAVADPPKAPPGCGFVSAVWWSPCHVPPPVPGQAWTPIDGVPGTFGPHGYTPIQQWDSATHGGTAASGGSPATAGR